jgi:hypothetical protein
VRLKVDLLRRSLGGATGRPGRATPPILPAAARLGVYNIRNARPIEDGIGHFVKWYLQYREGSG